MENAHGDERENSVIAGVQIFQPPTLARYCNKVQVTMTPLLFTFLLLLYAEEQRANQTNRVAIVGRSVGEHVGPSWEYKTSSRSVVLVPLTRYHQD